MSSRDLFFSAVLELDANLDICFLESGDGAQHIIDDRNDLCSGFPPLLMTDRAGFQLDPSAFSWNQLHSAFLARDEYEADSTGGDNESATHEAVSSFLSGPWYFTVHSAMGLKLPLRSIAPSGE
jgi:hypothetical protein